MSVESDLAWIDRSRKAEATWRGRARKVIELYRDESRQANDKNVRYNVLWANTEAMKPALYSAIPEPVVSRRYQDADPVGKAVSKVLERTLEYFEDCEDFDVQAKRCRDDLLLPGRGVVKVHYVPTMAYGDPPRIQVTPVYGANGGVQSYSDGENEYDQAEQDDAGFYVSGDPEEEVVDETVTFERVPWDLFVVDTQRCWDDVNKIAFGAFMDRGDLKKYFGTRKANRVSFTMDSTNLEGNQPNIGEKKYALVWEIWDKRKREVRHVTQGFDDYLAKTKDPLKLQGFFPTPRPVYAVETGDTLVPIPLYTLYQDQARELDITTARLYTIIDAMRVRGFYAGADEGKLAQLFESEDLALIPIENWSNIADKGGLDKMISWLPIEQLSKVAIGLHQHRATLIESIYEITGMSDILRGVTDPRETKGAQEIKSGYASRRLVEHQHNLQRYFRDLLRIAGEIVCEHFSAETLQRITGLPCTPEMKQLMQDDALRSYRVDVETDSTIAPDEQRDKEQAVEAITAMGTFIQGVAPLVQQGQLSPPVATEALKWFLRKFRMGRDLEDFVGAMEQMPPQPPPPDPKAQAEAEKAQVEAQIAQQKAQADMAARQQEMEMKKQELAFEMEVEKAKLQFEFEVEKARLSQELEIERLKAEADNSRRDKESEAKVDATRQQAEQAKQPSTIIKMDNGQEHAATVHSAIEKMSEKVGEAIKSASRPRRVIRDKSGEITGVE